ncbi:MAG TPA: NAD(P)/FAD-dependent oxidoreductase [Candidatus Sulfopaludibacter sp.]|nr:NAD(P)/FAD-dependent oxidoreductase [Candidatus Sulfopaludibacter sp.]
MERWDVMVIGGGPAGSTAARLLAQWGHRVAIVTVPPARRTLAECLPPSTKKVLQFLGIQETVERAGFLATTGNTVWWGARGRRVELYPAGSGYQVDRGAFDRVLLELARSEGASVRVERVPVGGPFDSRFVLDCSGRAGVLARKFRVKPRCQRTVALCGAWRSERGWRVPDASHTLVESYGDGWAWSVPLSAGVRHVAFMVDPVASRMVRGKGLAEAYAAELGKTRAFRRIFERSTLEGTPWGRDASLYTSRQFSGPGFVLAGDAGSFIDPLSSFGVKKAMVSGWAAAVVANTCLRRPAMQEVALEFFDERERAIEAHYRRQAGKWFQEEAGPFWEERAEAPESDTASVQAALDSLRRAPSIALRRGDGVRASKRAGIEGCEVVLREALGAPGVEKPVDFVANVEVVRLVEMAPEHRQVPDLFEAYNRACRPVELADFLRALATLVAQGVLAR